MSRRNGSRERGQLRRRLGSWREVVERSARGHRSDPRTYAALHGEILQRCKALAAESGEEQKRLYEGVEDLVRPWLTLAALTQTKQDILLEVLQRCRRSERDLGGAPWLELSRPWLRPALATLAGGTVLAVLAWLTVRWWLPLRSTFKGARFQINSALERMSVPERWMIGGTIAIVVVMILLSRTAKS
jgi:hypothetical protein